MGPLLGRWPEVSVFSVIDILLVAILIYEFLKLVKGTRAWHMMVGVGALALFVYLVRLGKLTTFNWLVSTILPYAAFALIVVFAAKSGRRWRSSDGSSASGAPVRPSPRATTTSSSPPTSSPRTRRAR